MNDEDLYLIKNAIQFLKNNLGFDEIKFIISVADVRVYWTDGETQPIIRIDLSPKF